jgi:hypothetical protein
MSFRATELYNCDWCKNAKMKYIGKKHRQCGNEDIHRLERTVVTDQVILECKNFKSPTFPYIDYDLLYLHLSQDSKDAQSIKSLMEIFFESMKRYGRIRFELYGEAYAIAERNGIYIKDFIKGDLEFFT